MSINYPVPRYHFLRHWVFLMREKISRGVQNLNFGLLTTR